MDLLQSSTEGGIAYPLNSKRFKLRHIQHLARALNLPTSATRGDLEVMISGRLAETNRDTTNIQVIVTQGEEGEQLSLRDMEGIFLVTPPILPLLVSKSSTPCEEESDLEGSFTAEMTQLQTVLQSFEEETVVLRTELQSTKKEVEQLRTKLKKANKRLVELWQENCKHLLDHDIVMTEKEKEVQLLRKQLQVRELELARLKLTNLREAPIQSGVGETTASEISQRTTTAHVGDYVSGLSLERISGEGSVNCQLWTTTYYGPVLTLLWTTSYTDPFPTIYDNLLFREVSTLCCLSWTSYR